MAMNQAQLRTDLEEQKAALTERVNRIKADVGRGLEADSKEQAAQLENQEVLDGLGNEATAEIANITAALKRMDEGVYGICTKCGVEIDIRRLTALPHSSHCIACASCAS
jgi:DnaK suppressor protein